jgi:hypothetical protein
MQRAELKDMIRAAIGADKVGVEMTAALRVTQAVH